MKIIISIPDDLFELAEDFAQQQGLSRSELYATALRAYLDAQATSAITEQLNNVYDSLSSNIDPSLMSAQIDILPRDEWE